LSIEHLGALTFRLNMPNNCNNSSTQRSGYNELLFCICCLGLFGLPYQFKRIDWKNFFTAQNIVVRKYWLFQTSWMVVE